MSLHVWEKWVAELGDTYRLVSFDWPGHGLSTPVRDDDYSRNAMPRPPRGPWAPRGPQEPRLANRLYRSKAMMNISISRFREKVGFDM